MNHITPIPVRARAPAKVILFGEHAINRGQAAVAVAMGLSARCQVGPADQYRFQSGERTQTASRQDILELSRRVEAYRAAQNFGAIKTLAREDFFAPQKYLLGAALGETLPEGLSFEWQSEVPPCSGLGSGGSAFVAMVVALVAALRSNISLEEQAVWAHRGDIVAHGGMASGLDTQASLLGGVIHYQGHGLAESIQIPRPLPILVAHCGVDAPTSEVNARVRIWLAANPIERIKYFEAMGPLSRAARPALAEGDWEGLGRLLTVNQCLLEVIGVSCPEINRLIKAAKTAGAFGAKLSGSGGGGIILALVSDEKKAAVARALTDAGGRVIDVPAGVEGARLEESAAS